MRLGKQIFDKRESLPECNGRVVSGACSFSARQTYDQVMSLTPGLSSVCSSHQDRSVAVPAEFGRADTAGFAVQPTEAHQRADTHTELLRNFRNRRAVLPRPNYACSQILRIRLLIPYWPLSSVQFESDSCSQGNPSRLNLFGKRL